ncbi:MAG TPA: adhesin, partial [Oscillibacter sp.]|nr:adhesin [Oscillibacter sp.]
MKRYRVQALCLLLAAALALTGCAARRGEEDTGRLQVVCTLFPYY